MKRTLTLLLISLFIVGALAGCGRVAKKNNKLKSNETSKTTSSIGDVKKMDDNEFITETLKGETELNLDNVEDTIDDLGDLDQLINSKDPIADIPKNVRVAN